MTWEAAMKTAFNQAKHFKEKRYVWAFITDRGGIVWTVTDSHPGIDFRDCTEWRDGRWHAKPGV